MSLTPLLVPSPLLFARNPLMFVSDVRTPFEPTGLPFEISLLWLRKFCEFLMPMKPAPLVDEGLLRLKSSRGSKVRLAFTRREYSVRTSELKNGCCRHC